MATLPLYLQRHHRIGAQTASDTPEAPNMNFGIIALTDGSPIIIAHENWFDIMDHRVEQAKIVSAPTYTN